MKTVDIARFIRHIGARDFVRASSMLEDIIKKETNVNTRYALEQAYKTWGTPKQMDEVPYNIKRFIYNVNKNVVLNDLKLENNIRKAIDYIVDTFNKKDLLQSNGLEPVNKILFAGPPGNGKTSVALALSKDMNIPLFKVNMAEVISGRLGETSKQIDNVFREVNNFGKGILFFDEIDTFATKRTYDNGCDKEISGAVNKMLQEIDSLNPNILFVCATNVSDELDPALLRRFNMKLWFKNPTREQIEDYIMEYFDKRNVDLDAMILSGIENFKSKSWSDAEMYCEAHFRRIVLDSETIIYGNEWIGNE